MSDWEERRYNRKKKKRYDPTSDPANYVTVTTTVVTPTTKYRTWVETSSSVSSSIVDTTSIPYIHATNIRILASNMRPYSRLYVMFDGVDVSNLCRPLSSAEYASNANGAASIGAAIYANAAGNAWIRFYIPARRFTTGRKLVVVTDSTDKAQQTTRSSAFFIANGTLQFSQSVNTIINKSKVESYIENITTQVSSKVYVEPPDNWDSSD